MPMPDGSLTDRECREELLKLARFLDENHPDDVKKNPTAYPADLAIQLLKTPACAGCGRVFNHGPFCVKCQ